MKTVSEVFDWFIGKGYIVSCTMGNTTEFIGRGDPIAVWLHRDTLELEFPMAFLYERGARKFKREYKRWLNEGA